MDRVLEYLSHHPWLATATAVVAALIVVYEMRARSESLVSVSPQELIRLMNQGALLLDVRNLDEFAAGHIGGARQLPPDQVPRAGETLKKHRENPVIVYGNDETAGPVVVRTLTAQGFTKAFCLRGGLATWRAENLPLAKG